MRRPADLFPRSQSSGRLRWRAALALLLAVACLPGCAWFADPNPPPFERMELEGQVALDDEGRLEGDIKARTTVAGAVVGAGAGSVTGGAAGVDASEEPMPDSIVQARLDKVKLRQHTSERASMRMWSSMDMTWDFDAEEWETRTCEYRWTSEPGDVEDFLLDDGELFQLALTEGIQTTAAWMARDLDAFANKTELAKWKGLPESCYQD
jgi:hypothetical protein